MLQYILEHTFLQKKTSNVLSIGEGIIGSASEERGRRRLDWHQGSSYLLPRHDGIACGWIHELGGGGVDGGGDAGGGGESDVDDATAEGGGDSEIAGGGIGGPTTKTTTTADDDVVLYSLKVSAEDLRGMEDGIIPAVGESTWVSESRGLFLGRLAGRADGETTRMRRLPRPQSSDDDHHHREGGGDGGAATEDDDDGTTTTIAPPVPPEGIVLSDDETLTMRRIIDLAR
jgi:hypothetical protein